VEDKTAVYTFIDSSVLKIDAASHSETAVNIYHNKHRHKLRM